jgi:cytochrome c
VMGAAMFSGGGFGYSDAVKSKAHGDWNYDNMSDWLSNPQGFAPGTAMSYSGIKNPQTRADVEAYLRTLAATPVALPSAADVKAADAAEAPAVTSAPDSATAAAAAPSIDTLFATADLNKGQAVVQQQCSSCHTVTKGGADGVGPNLYGIVGAESFHEAGFSYSDAVKSKAGSHWTADSLSDWLKDPNTYAPGTAMSFAGIKNDQTRADVIDWLNKDSDSPAKLP